VFCRVLEDKGDIQIDECATSRPARPPARLADYCGCRDKNVELVANDLLIIRYKPIRLFVEEASVLLV